MNSSMELQSLKPKTVDHSHSNIREKVFSCTNKKKKEKGKRSSAANLKLLLLLPI